MSMGKKLAGGGEEEDSTLIAAGGQSSAPDQSGNAATTKGKKTAKKKNRFQETWAKWVAVRELALYSLFVLLFTLAVFNAKPGWIQFELQKLHKASLGGGITAVANINQIYTWLGSTFADSFFPMYDAKGELLSAGDRLRVSGQSLVIGAARLRSVRALQRECLIPNFLKDINGQQALCSDSYSSHTRLTTNIYAANSSHMPDLAGANFTLPFKYRTATELDSTMLYTMQGVYAKYFQDGFALDVIPNVAPNQLAAYVATCLPNLADSLETCKNNLLADGTLQLTDFGFNGDDGTVGGDSEYNAKFFQVRRPPRAGAEGQRCVSEFDLEGNTCADMEQLFVPEALVPHLHRCQRVPDTAGTCQLPYVGFAQLYELHKPSRCGACLCMCDTDPVCASTCSAKDVFLDQLGMLKYFNWVNASTTRAVMLDVSMLNPHQNLMTMWRGVFEMPPTGQIQPYVTSDTVKLYRYTSFVDRVYLGGEIVLLALLAYYILAEVLEMRKEGRVYFKDAWNYVDWANYVLILAVVGIRVASIIVINNFTVESALTPLYVDYPPLAEFATTELNLLAFNFFLLYFKIFKYIKNLPKMNSIVMTIASAGFELVLFMVMAAIVLFGFCSAFYVSFGADVASFKGLGESLGSLFQVCLGVFDYKALAAANPPMAVLLFYLYIVVVVFVMLSMFVAIIDDAYSTIKDSQDEREAQAQLQRMMGNITNAFRRKKDLNSLGKALMMADHSGEGGNLDGMVDLEELREVLQDHPNALTILNCPTVEDVMMRFDDSGDGQLDRKELKAILEVLVSMEEEEQGHILNVEDQEMDPQEWNKLSLQERIDLGRKGFRPRSKLELDFKLLDNKVEEVEQELTELSHNVAKKLSLMVDLMVGLADTVNNPNRNHVQQRL